MDLESQVRFHYPSLEILKLESFGSGGGFSGGKIWKVHCPSLSGEANYCLRRWPDHPSDSHLAWIHRVIGHAFGQGCRFLAVPIANVRGETITHLKDEEDPSAEKSRWDLSPWMPGVANFSADRSPVRLKNMMQALAQFHLASAQINLAFHASPNLIRRYEQLRHFAATSEFDDLRGSNGSALRWKCETLDLEIKELQQLLSIYGRHLIQRLLIEVAWQRENGSDLLSHSARPISTSVILPVQPVLRDAWHDHILFTHDEVTGIIDYGAMQIDNVVFDIVRLLGTTVVDDFSDWDVGIAAYEDLRRLQPEEKALIRWVDQSSIVLGSLHWLRWLLIEQRNFESWESVANRICFLKKRLQNLVN
jgi:Ser/Thr protein kinase RdoA (MazF antagonist)